MKKVIYNDTTLEVQDHVTAEQVKQSMARIFPELANASVTESNNEIRFSVNAGTKGSQNTNNQNGGNTMNNNIKVVYNDTNLEVPAGTSVEAIKASMSRIFPELANAQAVQNGNTVTFQVAAGTKGLEVRYNDTSLNVPDGTSTAAIKESMTRIFPELANATATEANGVVTFSVNAGTKGLEVRYNDTTLNVPDGTSTAAIKESMTRIFPELANATATEANGVVTFAVNAGTKGLEVRYNDTSLNVPDGTSVDAIKASMTRIFPELASATASESNGVVTFSVNAGTKGN
jgi:ethanolamine ammonia-lyase small subunit